MNAKIAIYIVLAGMLALSWAASCVIYQAAAVGERIGPLEERQFERLTVVAVGSGGSYENPERRGPSIAIARGGEIWLVDAGRGVAEGLRLSRISTAQPSRVLLTSLMPVNVQGLDDLLLTGWLNGRDTPLEVVGPVGTTALVSGLLEAHQRGIAGLAKALGLPASGARMTAVEVGDGFQQAHDGLELRAAALDGGPVPALAWSFEADGERVVVGGTGWDPETLVAFSEGADLLVHEAIYVPPPEDLEEAGVIADPDLLARQAALHTSILDVGALAERAGVSRLALVRMRPPPFFTLQVSSVVDDDFGGELVIPEDGEQLLP